MIFVPVLKNVGGEIFVEEFYCNGFDNKVKLDDLLYSGKYNNTLNILSNFTLAKPSILFSILKNDTLHEKESKKDFLCSYDIKNNYIKIYFNKQNVFTICSYENKFMQDFCGFETALYLEKMDTEKCETCTRDSYNEFYKSLSKQNLVYGTKKIFEEIFPQLDDIEFDFLENIKENCKSIMYYKKSGIYDNLYSYDIKSSFPSRVYKSIYPRGKGIRFESFDEVPSNKWWCVKILIYKVRFYVYDFFGIYDKYIKNEDEDIYFYLTKDMYEILEDLYDIDFDLCFGYYYRLATSIFDKFIYKNIYRDENNFKPYKKYSKAKNNVFIGSTGRSRNIYINHYKIIKRDVLDLFEPKNDKVYEKIVCETKVEEADKKGYYPFYCYINGKAKCELIKAILDYFDDIVYINTDGFFSTKELNFDLYNGSYIDGIGKIEFRHFYITCVIKEISNYMAIYSDENGEIKTDVKISGMLHKEVTYEDFINGFDVYNYAIGDSGFPIMITFRCDGLKDFENEEYITKRIKEENMKLIMKNNIMVTMSDEYKTLDDMELRLKRHILNFIINLEKTNNKKESFKQLIENDDGFDFDLIKVVDFNSNKLDLFEVKKDFKLDDMKFKKGDIISSDLYGVTKLSKLLKLKLIKQIKVGKK